jgi:hypothetical protein
MASELAFSLTGPQRKMVSAIQRMISVAELSANRGSPVSAGIGEDGGEK